MSKYLTTQANAGREETLIIVTGARICVHHAAPKFSQLIVRLLICIVSFRLDTQTNENTCVLEKSQL